MKIIKKKTHVLFARGITSVNKSYVTKAAKKNKCSMGDIVNQILKEKRSDKR